MSRNQNNNTNNHNNEVALQLIIDCMAKDSAVQQGTLKDGHENTFIDTGIFRKVEGEYVLDMYVLKGLDYSQIDALTLLMSTNYTEVDIREDDEALLGLDVDEAIGKILNTFPAISGFHVRYFRLPDYAYLPLSKGGIDTSLFIPLTQEGVDKNTNYVDVNHAMSGFVHDLTGSQDLDADLDEALDEFVNKIDKLSGELEYLGDNWDDLDNYDLEENWDYTEDTEDELLNREEMAEVKIYLYDDLDIDKVERDGLNLEDDSIYQEVYLTDEEILGMELDVTGIIKQLGYEPEDCNIRFLSFPQEYYVKTEEGGEGYKPVKASQDTQDKDNALWESLNALTDDMMEMELHFEAGVDADKVSEGVSKAVADAKRQYKSNYLGKMGRGSLSEAITNYTGKDTRVEGYYVLPDTQDEDDSWALNIVVKFKGVPDYWLMTFVKSSVTEHVTHTDGHQKDTYLYKLTRTVRGTIDELDKVMLEDAGNS